MNGKYILISGSAGRSCPAEVLNTAIVFVRSFTEEVLRRGGGIVVLAGDEESTMDEHGTPRIFDWVALREVDRYSASTAGSPRTYAWIIMSDEAPDSKIEDANLRLLRDLEQRKVVERRHIRRQLFTGEAYRNLMTFMSDAMLAIGGGKGTYSAGAKMTELGKPVLPLDLQLGSMVDDGDGAVDLHREMLSEPERFFPITHSDVINRMGMLSLNRGINETGVAARSASEVLERELEAAPAIGWRENVRRRFVELWKFANSFPPIAAAIKIVEFVRGFL